MQNRSHNKYFHFTHLRCKHTIFYVLNSLIVFYFLAALVACWMVVGVFGAIPGCIWVNMNTLTSKNASCVGFQKPRALMSKRASSPTITDLYKWRFFHTEAAGEVLLPHYDILETADLQLRLRLSLHVSHNTLQTVLQWLHPPIDYGDYGDYTHYSDYSDSWYYYNDIILLVLSLSRYTLQPMHYTQIWGQWVIACCKNLHMNRAR